MTTMKTNGGKRNVLFVDILLFLNLYANELNRIATIKTADQ